MIMRRFFFQTVKEMVGKKKNFEEKNQNGLKILRINFMSVEKII